MEVTWVSHMCTKKMAEEPVQIVPSWFIVTLNICYEVYFNWYYQIILLINYYLLVDKAIILKNQNFILMISFTKVSVDKVSSDSKMYI